MLFGLQSQICILTDFDIFRAILLKCCHSETKPEVTSAQASSLYTSTGQRVRQKRIEKDDNRVLINKQQMQGNLFLINTYDDYK